MGEQTENIERVKVKIGSSVLHFIEYVGLGKTFHADDLRNWVIEETHVAPASSDRILRDLRQKGYIDYIVINRRKSLYCVTEVSGEYRSAKVEERKMKLYNLTKSTKEGCEANRCKIKAPLTEIPGDLWARTKARLCPRHVEEALAFAKANPDFKPEEALAASPEPEPSLDDQLERVKEEAEKVLEKLEGREVKTQDDLVEISGWLQSAKDVRNWLEDREKKRTQPIQIALQEERTRFAPAKDTWANVEGALRAKITKASTEGASAEGATA